MLMTREATGNGRRGLILLAEPYFVVRRTVASVICALDLADICEASNTQAARVLVQHRAFDLVVVALSDDLFELELIRDLRAGKTASAADVKVALTCNALRADTVASLRDLHVSRVIVRPFKVKTIVETVSQLFTQAAETA